MSKRTARRDLLAAAALACVLSVAPGCSPRPDEERRVAIANLRRDNEELRKQARVFEAQAGSEVEAARLFAEGLDARDRKGDPDARRAAMTAFARIVAMQPPTSFNALAVQQFEAFKTPGAAAVAARPFVASASSATVAIEEMLAIPESYVDRQFVITGLLVGPVGFSPQDLAFVIASTVTARNVSCRGPIVEVDPSSRRRMVGLKPGALLRVRGVWRGSEFQPTDLLPEATR